MLWVCSLSNVNYSVEAVSYTCDSNTPLQSRQSAKQLTAIN